MIRSSHIALVSRSLAIALALLGATALSPRSAMAQDQAAVDKLVQMNKKALDDYDTLDFDAAKRILLDALVAGKKAGLDNHPVMGRTYIHLGAVYITGFKDRQKGLQSFQRALEIDPTIQLSKGIETAEVTATFAEAQRNRVRRQRRSSPAVEGAMTTTRRRRPRRSAVVRSWRGTPPRGRPPEAEEASPERRRGARSAGPRRRARLSGAGRGDHRQAAYRPLRRGPQPAGGQRLSDVPRARQGGIQRGPHDQEPQRVAPGQDPQEGGHREISPVLLRGAQRRRQAGGRQRRLRQPEHRARRRGGVEGRGRQVPVGEEDENPLEENEGNQRPRLHLGHVDKEREGLDTRYGKRKWWIGIGSGPATATPRGTDSRRSIGRSIRQFHGCRASSNRASPGPESASWSRRLATRSRPAWRSRWLAGCSTPRRPSKYADFTYKGAIGVMAKLLFYTKQSQLRFFIGPLAGGGNFRFLGYPDTGASQRLHRLQGHHRGRPSPGRRGRRPLLRGGQGGLAGRRDQRDRRVADLRPRSPTSTSRCSSIFIRRRRPNPPAALDDGLGSRRAKIASAEAGARARRLVLGRLPPGSALPEASVSAGRPRWRRSAWLRSARPVAASQRIAPAA